MLALVRAVRMAIARASRQAAEGRRLGAAIFAGILGFLLALIEGVFPAIGAIRVAVAGAAGQAGDTGCFGAAVFAGVIWHFILFGLSIAECLRAGAQQGYRQQ